MFFLFYLLRRSFAYRFSILSAVLLLIIWHFFFGDAKKRNVGKVNYQTKEKKMLLNKWEKQGTVKIEINCI